MRIKKYIKYLIVTMLLCIIIFSILLPINKSMAMGSSSQAELIIDNASYLLCFFGRTKEECGRVINMQVCQAWSAGVTVDFNLVYEDLSKPQTDEEIYNFYYDRMYDEVWGVYAYRNKAGNYIDSTDENIVREREGLTHDAIYAIWGIVNAADKIISEYENTILPNHLKRKAETDSINLLKDSVKLAEFFDLNVKRQRYDEVTAINVFKNYNNGGVSKDNLIYKANPDNEVDKTELEKFYKSRVPIVIGEDKEYAEVYEIFERVKEIMYSDFGNLVLKEEFTSIERLEVKQGIWGIRHCASFIIKIWEEELNGGDYRPTEPQFNTGQEDNTPHGQEPPLFGTIRKWISDIGYYNMSNLTPNSLDIGGQYSDLDALKRTLDHKWNELQALSAEDHAAYLRKAVDFKQEKLVTLQYNGYEQFSEKKDLLSNQLDVVIEALNEMESRGNVVDNYTTIDESDDRIEEARDLAETSISGTVIMGSLEPDLDGDNTDPRENPESYRPEGFSEDGERLKEIGQIIIGVLRVVGVLVAVVTLLALGIRYMAGGASERAEYKKSMIPFLIGAFVLLIGTQLIGILYDLMVNVNS